MIYRGGQGALEFAQALQVNATAAPLFISFSVNGQASGSETALFCINCGLNDRNDDGQLSVGPIGGLDSATPAGYADNVRAIINAIETAWAGNGYARKNLYFLLQPSHPISVPDDSELVGYRNAVRAIADQYTNTAAQDLNHPYFANALANNAAAWYASGGSDRLHMTQTGYEQLYTLVTRELLYSAFNV
jgi:lysophospholipase L1-like esterase